MATKIDENEIMQSLSDDDLQILDKQLEEPSESEIESLVVKSLAYIYSLKTANDVLNDIRAFRIIQLFGENSKNNAFLTDELYKYKNIIKLLWVDVLKYYISDLKAVLNSETKASLTQFVFIEKLLLLIRNITNGSKASCFLFHDLGGTKVLLAYLDDDDLARKCVHFKSDNNASSTGLNFMLLLMGVVYNLSTIADYRKKDFETIHASSTIEKFKEIISFDEHGRLLTCITLANIISDNNIENAIDTESTIGEIVKLIRYGADLISLKVNLKRLKINLSSNVQAPIIDEVCVLNDDWTIIDLLLALYRLAVIDKLKLEIFETHNIKIELQKIFVHGNDTEKEYAAKLLWQLCFDKRIAKKVQQDSQFLSHFADVADRMDIIDQNGKKLKKYCKGIIWSIEKSTNAVHMNSTAQERKHIMISYNIENRQECLKIAHELEHLGYNVWIDIEKIYGSSLEAMAQAVENSQCVLMCMTEKYKQSPNCRAEAEYAFKLNVPIIPVIMQLSYMPDGWLGIILGSKVFINFTKYPFDECMRRLMMELRNLKLQEVTYDEDKSYSQSVSKLSFNTNQNNQQQQQQLKVRSSVMKHIKKIEIQEIRIWSQADVGNWLSTNKISSDIIKQLKYFNGELLTQLNSIRFSAPEYFYQTISRNHKIDMHHVVHFVNELEKLFD